MVDNEYKTRGAVHIVNEVFGCHPVDIAHKLHPNTWSEWIRSNRPYGFLNLDQVLNDPASRLLLAEKIGHFTTDVLTERERQVTETRFGLETGEIKSFASTRKELGISDHRVRVLQRNALFRIRPVFPREEAAILLDNKPFFTYQMAIVLNGLDRKYLAHFYPNAFSSLTNSFLYKLVTLPED